MAKFEMPIAALVVFVIACIALSANADFGRYTVVWCAGKRTNGKPTNKLIIITMRRILYCIHFHVLF